MSGFALCLAACAHLSRHESDRDTSDFTEADSLMSADYTEQAYCWADSVLSSMTLAQKAGQLFMPAIYSIDDAYSMKHLRFYADSLCVGGVVLLKGGFTAARNISDTLRRYADVLPFVAIDAEWGLKMRLHDAPLFPANGEISESADENLLYDYGSEMARECRLAGINMVLGPVFDVVTSGRGMMGKRSFGSDPERVSSLGVAYSRGLEDGGVLSVAKHFPGHGGASTDSHRELSRLKSDRHHMDSVDLRPFRDYVNSGLSAVMVGHIYAPALDSVPRPAAFSPAVVGILRNDMGFHGLVITDALNMGGARGFDATDALRAGADLILAPADTRREIDNVVRSVKTGQLPEARVDESCRRVLFFKYILKMGILPQAVSSESLDTPRVRELNERLL